MENIIVATFTGGENAIQAFHKLGELDREGDINIYDKVMIRKGLNEEFEVLKDDNTNGWRTLAGMAFGGLIGLFGGPIGLAIGLYIGTSIGAIIDYSHYSFEQDFINVLGKNTPSGTTSIIAEVDEESSIFIDEYLKPLGAVIWRSNVYVEHEKFVEKQVNSLDTEIQTAENELVAAAEAQKVKISAKVAELRANRNAKVAEIELKSREKLYELKSKMELNLAKLQTQFANLKNQALDKIDSVRLERAQEKLAQYQLKINELNEKLRNLKHAHAV